MASVWGVAGLGPSPADTAEKIVTSTTRRTSVKKIWTVPATLSPLGLKRAVRDGRGRWGGRRGGGTGCGGGSTGQTEPRKDVISLDWDVMCDTGSADCLEVGAVGVACPA